MRHTPWQVPPPTLAGDIVWCQGYSERGSGSDLASLQTKAVEDGAPAALQALLQKRQDAKKQKDWATADAVRDEIARAGWKIVDTPQGARLERA